MVGSLGLGGMLGCRRLIRFGEIESGSICRAPGCGCRARRAMFFTFAGRTMVSLALLTPATRTPIRVRAFMTGARATAVR